MTRQTAYTSKRKADSENELSLIEFVDLVFEELGDKWKFKRARTIDYSADLCSVYWRETIIPCVTELNEMAKNDSTIFEFFVVFYVFLLMFLLLFLKTLVKSLFLYRLK